MFEIDNDHQYWLDGKAIPGVSEIMKDAGLVKIPIDNDYIMALIERKRIIGTAVHKALELYDSGTLDESSLDETVVPYFKAYVDFLNEYKPEIVEVEKLLHNKQYAGTLDRVIKINDTVMILDIKTGTPKRSHKIQTLAYKELYLCNVENPEHIELVRACLYLTNNATFKLSKHENDLEDSTAWLSALNIFNFNHPRYSCKKQKSDQKLEAASW